MCSSASATPVTALIPVRSGGAAAWAWRCAGNWRSCWEGGSKLTQPPVPEPRLKSSCRPTWEWKMPPLIERGRALVVDDAELNRILARAYLEALGWRVDECPEGYSALAFL